MIMVNFSDDECDLIVLYYDCSLDWLIFIFKEVLDFVDLMNLPNDDFSITFQMISVVVQILDLDIPLIVLISLVLMLTRKSFFDILSSIR